MHTDASRPRTLIWLPAGTFLLFQILYLVCLRGNLRVLWQPGIYLLCLGLCGLARGISGREGLVPLGRTAARDPAVRLARARLGARAVPMAFAAYALLTSGIMLFFTQDLVPEQIGQAAARQLIGAGFFTFFFLLCAPRIYILQARVPSQPVPPDILAGPSMAMVGIIIFLLPFNLLFLDGLLSVHEAKVFAFESLGSSIPELWKYLTLEELAEGMARVFPGLLGPMAVMGAWLWGVVRFVGGSQALPGLRASVRALCDYAVGAACMFTLAIGFTAYREFMESPSTIAALSLLLPSCWILAALVRWLVRSEESGTVQEPEPETAPEAPALSRSRTLAWGALALVSVVLGLLLEYPPVLFLYR